MAFPGENPALDAETRVSILLGVSIAFIIASTVVVALRLFTRQYVVHGLGPDDYTIVLAQFLNFGVSATTILQAKYGLGRHVWLVDNESNMQQLKSLFAAMIIYNLSQIITKISFLLQYRRIFQDKFTQRACLVLLVFLGTWGFAQEFLVGHACVPASIIFPSLVGKCIGALTVWYLTSIMNIVTDFIVFLVPMPAIRHLQLRRKQKLLVTGVFCLGFFTCIISIVRLFTLRGAINTDDPTWDNVPTSYWTVVELNCGIICASIATLRPLLRHVFPSLSSHSAADYYLKQPSTPKGSSIAAGRRVSSGGTASAAAAAAAAGRGIDGIYALRDVESGGSQDGLNKSGADEYYGWTGYGWNGVPASKLSTSVRGGKAGREAGAAGEDGSFGSTLAGASPRQIRVTRETTFRESRNDVSWK